MDPTIDVALEFVPAPSATELRRDAVTAAADGAGLVISSWSTARRTAQRGDPPSLDIRVSSRYGSRDYQRGDLARAVARELSGFCGALRANLPELPFGIIEQVGRTTTWFGFRLGESSSEIARALDSLAEWELPRGKAFGWDAAAGTWQKL